MLNWSYKKPELRQIIGSTLWNWKDFFPLYVKLWIASLSLIQNKINDYFLALFIVSLVKSSLSGPYHCLQLRGWPSRMECCRPRRCSYRWTVGLRSDDCWCQTETIRPFWRVAEINILILMSIKRFENVQCMSPLNLPLDTMSKTDMGYPHFAKIPKRIHITTILTWSCIYDCGTW